MDRKALALIAASLVALGGWVTAIVNRATQGHPHVRHAVYAVENEVTKLVREGFVAATGSCGVERWDEKTLSTVDPASAPIIAVQNEGRSVLTNIPNLRAMPVPGGSAPTGLRVAGSAEQEQWKLAGTHVIAYKLEADSDYHLELKSAINGTTMIAEIPDPGCVSNPAAKTLITQARNAFNTAVAPNAPTGYYQYLNPNPAPINGVPQPPGMRVTLTGPAFFDFIHGQLGVAPNGIEIHPVLSFKTW
jgi:hypothetical protein